ncbi:MAG: hypothetical protein ACXU95_11255 [Isosphaeraceae bacterium]
MIMRGEYDGLAVRLKDQEGDGISGGFDAFLKRKVFKPPTDGSLKSITFGSLPTDEPATS